MTTIRVAKRERWTSIDRRVINDERLSFRARGILIWLLDKPDDWRVDSEQIADAAKEGRDAVRTALNELVQCGYIVRHRERDARGKWVTWTEVHECPGQTEDGKPGVGNPADETVPDAWESGVGEPGALTKTVTDDCAVPTSVTSSTARADAEFERWWGKYPKKASGKGEARTRWRKMTVADRKVAFDGIDRHATWWAEHATEPQYIPSGAVWLNQRRWEDDEPRTLNGHGVKPDVMEQARLLLAREGPRP